MKLSEIIADALKEENKVSSLADAVVGMRQQGIDKITIIAELNLYYDQTQSEAEQDAIADVQDFLYGYCSPHLRID